jgi:hypothetical protein
MIVELYNQHVGLAPVMLAFSALVLPAMINSYSTFTLA